jgi:energy-coupling factor transporter ATP-binding protein EcfA2
MSFKLFHKTIECFENKDFAIFDILNSNNKPIFNDLSVNHNENSKTLIIYGDNASGKSFFSSIINQIFNQEKVPVRSVSMANRTKSGMEKAMIFGNESEQSTGTTSVSVISLALNSALNDDDDSLVILDEPDIGLSPRFSKALARYINDFYLNESDNKYLVLVSHNAEFMSHFLKLSKVPVSSIGINTTMSLTEWINNDVEATVDELLGLKDIEINTWRAIVNGLK